MWYWIAAFFGGFLVFEESIYYVWNRFLYGKKQPHERKWLVKVTHILQRWKHRKQIDVDHNQ